MPLGRPGLGATTDLVERSFEDATNEFGEEAAALEAKQFVQKLREHNAATFTDMAATEPAETGKQIFWCSGLGRAVPGIRWGFALQPAGSVDYDQIQVQPNRFDAVNQLSEATGGVAPEIVGQLNLRTPDWLGSWPRSPDSRLNRPLLLGVGVRKDLLDTARATGLEILVLGHFGTKTVGGEREISLTLRMLDVDTGQQLVASETVTESDFRRETGASRVDDPVGRAVTKLTAFARESLTLEPLPEKGNETLQSRIETLSRGRKGVSPTVALEVLAYRQANLLSESAALPVLKTIFGSDASARQFLTGDGQQRAELMRRLFGVAK